MTTIIICTIIILLIIYIYYIYNHGENFINYKQCSNSNINSVINSRIKKVFDNYTYDPHDWDLYLPCGYTDAESELRNVKFNNNKQSIFAIDGCDKLASKSSLANLLKKKYGTGYSNYIPKSYLNNSNDIHLLLQNHQYGNKYIAKKNIQQQKGIHIIHDYKEVKKIVNDKSFVIIQELLNNPFLINGHKINIRIYLLITCKGGVISSYIHSNGFMYYTPDAFDYESKKDSSHITTGYISRKIYSKNPLTLQDFYNYLDKNGYNSEKFNHNIHGLFRNVMTAINPGICKTTLSNNNLLFQLFGADIAPDNNLNVKLIEINKGPDLGGKDIQDNRVKNSVVKDIFKTIGSIPDKNNGFKKIW